MLFIKLLAFVLCFAIPLGILCGLAVKQAQIGRISRFSSHAVSFRSMFFKIVLVVVVMTALAIHRGTFSFITLGLIAMVALPTILVGYLTYTLAMRAKVHSNAVIGSPVTGQNTTKSKQAGATIAEWVSKNTMAAKVIFWGIFALAIALFVHMLFDITSKGKWITACVIFLAVGLRVLSISKTAKHTTDKP